MTRRTTPAAEAAPAAEAQNPAARPPAPDFTPVPRQCKRHDGWTPTRQRAFIDALADSGSVKVACAAVNMSTEGAYHLRRQPGAEAFDAAWAAALAPRIEILRDDVLERAIHGVEVPVYSYGKLVGTRRVYNDRTALFMLRNYDGQMSGGASGLPVRLKRIVEEEVAKARAEWEAERRRNHEDAKVRLIEDMNRVRARLIAQGLVEDDEPSPASEP
jgi:hypothetical protein